jgi:hypothetical protein
MSVGLPLKESSEEYRHKHNWSDDEITVAVAGVGGQQNLGSVVTAAKRRIRALTIRHEGTNNTVVTLLVAGGARKKSINILAQTTREWSEEDGAKFVTGEQPAVQSSDVTGGFTYISGSGLEG